MNYDDITSDNVKTLDKRNIENNSNININECC